MRKSLGVLILGILVLLINTGMAQTLNKGPISEPSLGITTMKLGDTNVTYGANVTLTVIWDYFEAKTNGTRYIAIIDWTTYRTKVNVSGTFSVANASDPANNKWFVALPEDGGSQTYTISTLDAKMLSSYYVVVVFSSKGVYNDQLCFIVESITNKPELKASIYPSTVALGDKIKLSYEMVSPRSEAFAVSLQMILHNTTLGRPVVLYADCMNNTWSLSPKIYVTAYFNEEWKGPTGTWAGCPKYFTISPTYFSSTARGYLAITFVAGRDASTLLTLPESEKTSTAAVTTIEPPTISTLTVPSEHVRGTDLVVSGTVNVAATNSEFDAGVPNKVDIYLMNLEDIVLFNTSTVVGRDGTFKLAFSSFGRNPYHPNLSSALPAGYYKLKFVLITDIGFTDEKSAMFELINGQVKIYPDKTTVTRGDKLKFTIRTNLKTANPVWFTIEDTRIMKDPPATPTQTITLYVDPVGCAYYELNVSPTAPLTEYRFKAEIEGNVTDIVTISVVEQSLELEAEKLTVARGGEIRFTGKTSADAVYVFSSEPRIFKDVTEVPSDTKFPITSTMKKFLPDSEGNLNFKVEVLMDASPGTYELYFYAPTNASEIDRSGDPQAVFSIEVTDPRIVSVDIPSIIPYQGKVEITIKADPGKREKANVTWTLEGSNIKAKPTDFGNRTSIYYALDSNNEVRFYLDLKEYKRGDKVVDPGLYEFTVKLYLGSEKVDEMRKLIEISAVRLDVTIEPETIVVGDQIKVMVKTNREGVAGYDHIWVTLVGTNYKATRKVILDSSGEGVAKFNTSGIAEGTYKIYVRDTMNTIEKVSELKLAEDLYDLDPADPSARLYKAQDDLLIIRTVQILKEKPTPTTPLPTTPPATTIETPTTPATTPTPTPPPTTPKTTPPTTPTTTPAPGPIPGFEAIFAIAGLLAVAYLLRRR